MSLEPSGRDIQLASLGESPDSLVIELGLAPAPVKREGTEVGSAPMTGDDLGSHAETVPLLPPAPDVRAPVRLHIDLRPEVRLYLERFQTGYRRAVVERWLSRSGRYAEMIRDVLLQAGLPEELIFTAMIESGFDPLAASRAGAKGLWQFMTATARRYGLRVDRWLDERLDPEKSTLAAARYLGDLYGMFGSWHLVQAAYNAGETRIVRAMAGTRSSDFWELARTQLLADETKNFVAAIQAATLIGREPDRYGFVVALEEPLRYEEVRVPSATSFKKLAVRSGVPEAELRRLNPEIRQGQTPPGEAYAVKVPPGTAKQVAATLNGGIAADSPSPKSAVVTVATRPARKPVARAVAVHVVKPKETMGGIARRYGVSAAEIARWNRLEESSRIYPGDRLRVAALAPADRASGKDEGQGGFR